MKKLHQAALGIALLALANIASAQTPAPSATNGQAAQPSKDPFVEARDEKAKARAEYKKNKAKARSEYKGDKKASKVEYKQAKKKANEKLKASGVQSQTQQNLETPAPGK